MRSWDGVLVLTASQGAGQLNMSPGAHHRVDDAVVVVASINGISSASRAPTVRPTAKFYLMLFENRSQKQLFADT
jgi:hypothetical protein